MLDAVRALHDEGCDAIKIAEAYLVISESGKYTSVGEEAIKEIIAISGQNPLHVLKFLKAVGEMQRRSIFLYGRVKQKTWDCAVSLDRLFEGEHIPDDPMVYLDQRYIDYLARNSEEMGRIHVRSGGRLYRVARAEYETECPLLLVDPSEFQWPDQLAAIAERLAQF